MTSDALNVPASLWDAPPPPLRRDARTAAAGLPAAAPVAHAASAPGVHSGRLAAGFAGIAAIGVAATVAGALAFATVPGGVPVTATVSDHAPAEPRSGASLAEEGGARGGTDLRIAEGGQDAGAILPVEERIDAAPHAGSPFAPESQPAPPDAPGATPDAGSREPAQPVPSTPAPAPVPSGPAPSEPAPPNPPAPAAPAAPAPLAFTGMTADYAINLLGIKVLASYTLSLSGEPGSTASVSYGSLPAGSVTFDSRGRATLKIGGGLIGLINPTVRAWYTDGTAGDPIQARRDDI